MAERDEPIQEPVEHADRAELLQTASPGKHASFNNHHPMAAQDAKADERKA